MNYSFYDKSGKQCYDYDLSRIYDSGTYGKVYKLDSRTLLKIFTNNIDEETFRTIMEMNLENFCQIYQMLYDENGRFTGYTMKKYDELYVDVLTLPVDYTLDNLRRIEESIKRLTKENILIEDMRDGNAITDDNNVTIIDFDLYKIMKLSGILNISFLNNTALLHLFNEMYYRCLCVYHDKYFMDKETINCLFDMSNSVEDVSKKLKKYKYPIDYIYERRGRNYGAKAIR